ncbi:MAG: two-component system response regulator FixJ [Candidatus Pseudothioglobus sp.]|jgi:two-component system response regulator FixJ
MSKPEPIVYVIDDDADVRKSLNLLFVSVNSTVVCYPGAVQFLKDIDNLQIENCCIIADVRMPSMTGIELLAELKKRGKIPPIIFISGHGDIAMAVSALKAGATDFLTKPFSEEILLEAVNSALRRQDKLQNDQRDILAYSSRYATLTPREKQIMARVVNGDANKVIALDLNITQRTVELHRSNTMQKMEARTFSDLVRMAIALNTIDDSKQ